MLRDEVPRTPVLLLFAPDIAAAESDLLACAELSGRLAKARLKLLVVSGSALADLQAVQREHELPYPLLHDDRGFSIQYGLGEPPKRALVLVGRDQRVAWVEQEPGDVGAAIGRALATAARMPSPTSGYPRSVINRLVDRWVN
jgi:peroxiredoxin